MSTLTKAQVAAYARQAGWPESEIPKLVGVVGAESGYNPRALNPNASTGDYSMGLAQVNMLGSMGPERMRQFGLKSQDELYDPLTNLKAARKIFESQGWNAWSVARSGKYQDYLPKAGELESGSFGSGSTQRPAGAALGLGTDQVKEVGGMDIGAASRAISGAAQGAMAPAVGLTGLAGVTGSVDGRASSSLPAATGLASVIGLATGGKRPQISGLMDTPAVDFSSVLGDNSLGGGQSQGLRSGQATQGQVMTAQDWMQVPGLTTGNSGGSTGEHTDARWGDRSPIKATDLDNYLRIGGKRPSEYPVTSPYGNRVHPISGQYKLHAGVDLGTPRGLPISVAPGSQLVRQFYDEGGGGYVKEVKTPDGRIMQLLHLDPMG